MKLLVLIALAVSATAGGVARRLVADDAAVRAVHRDVVARLAGVRVLLKHSAECSIRDLRDVDYRDGGLVFVASDGDRVFAQLEENKGDLLGSFPENQARAFVREFRRLKAGYR